MARTQDSILCAPLYFDNPDLLVLDVLLKHLFALELERLTNQIRSKQCIAT